MCIEHQHTKYPKTPVALNPDLIGAGRHLDCGNYGTFLNPDLSGRRAPTTLGLPSAVKRSNHLSR